MKDEKYYDFQDILRFLGIKHEFEKKGKTYPFNRGKEKVEFSWGQILIPKYGIREMVKNKVSDISEKPISKILMMYQIPFKVEEENGSGIINKNISLTFRYDKEFKYGDVNKSIYEVCFFILERGIRTNDFYIITDDSIHEFMSWFVINNQCGLGAMNVCSTVSGKLN